MERTKDLLVIMPAYNEGACIGAFLDRLEAAGIPDLADMLVIDDGSSDDTGRVAGEHGCAVVAHVYNMGYGAALLSGYKYAVRWGYEYVIQIDSDGQHDPCNIRPIYKRLKGDGGAGGPDIVLGSRFLEGGKSFPVSWAKKAAIGFFRKLVHLFTGKTVTDPTSGLQGLGGRVLQYYSAYSNFDDRYPDANMLIQMLLLGYRVEEIPAVMHAREVGGSKMHGGLKPVFYMAHMAVSICAVLSRILVMRAEARSMPAERAGERMP